MRYRPRVSVTSSQIVTAPTSPLQHRISPPGSKSLTNRAFILAALAEGDSQLKGCLVSEDSVLMREALRALEVPLRDLKPEKPWVDCEVQGQGAKLGRADADLKLEVGTAGTVARFLSAALASTGAQALVDGSPRMRERPMGLLIEELQALGAGFEFRGQPNALPFFIQGRNTALRGGERRIDRPASSQFISALAIAALSAESTTLLDLHQGCPARPYVDMTLSMIQDFDGEARWLDDSRLEIKPSRLRGREIHIEPDASGASYFLALAAIYGGWVEIPALGHKSQQGDANFHAILARMGAKSEQGEHSTKVWGQGTLHGAQLDLSDMPDMTLTAAVVALFADSPTTITGVEILRHHECDRLAAGATELRKLGALVQENPDGLHIVPPGVKGNPTATIRKGVAIDTYLDHRVAMAFSLAGEVEIRNPQCTHKTYPGYFDQLKALGMTPKP